jgi:tetratricopeptide (TPR) repeat protein
MKPRVGFLALALLLAASSLAAAEPTEADSEFARLHYEDGLQLARAGRYEDALQEFLLAYEKSPHFAVLYNIGQTYIALKRPVEALGALERYLKEGRDEIPPDRVERVKKQIVLQRTEVGELRILVNVPGAAIELDGTLAGYAPMLEPLPVAPGTHLVSVTAPKRPPLLRSVTVAAGQALELNVELAPAPAARRAVQPEPGTRPSARLSSASRGPSAVKAAPNSTLRTLGYVLGGSGVVLGGTAVGHYLWNRSRHESWQAEDSALGAERVQGDRVARQHANNELATSIDRAESVTLALALSAAGCLAAGTTLVVMNSGHGSVQPTVAMHSGIRLGVRGQW